MATGHLGSWLRVTNRPAACVLVLVLVILGVFPNSAMANDLFAPLSQGQLQFSLPNTIVTGIVASIDIPQICFPMPSPWTGVSPYRATANYVIQIQNYTTSGGPPLYLWHTLNITYSYPQLPQIQPGDLVQAYGWFYTTFDMGCDSTMQIGPYYEGSYLSVVKPSESPQVDAVHHHNYTLPSPLLEVDLNLSRSPLENSHLIITAESPTVNWLGELDLGYLQWNLQNLQQETGWIVASSTIYNEFNQTGRTRVDLELKNVTYTKDPGLWHVDLQSLIPWTRSYAIIGQTLTASWDDFGYTKLVVTTPANAYGLSYDPSKQTLAFQIASPDQLAMAINPRNLTVSQGSSETVEITFPSIGDLGEGSIALSAATPAGIRIDFSSNPIPLLPHQVPKITATITVDPNVSKGNYTLDVMAKYGSVSYKSSLGTTVVGAVLPDAWPAFVFVMAAGFVGLIIALQALFWCTSRVNTAYGPFYNYPSRSRRYVFPPPIPAKIRYQTKALPVPASRWDKP